MNLIHFIPEKRPEVKLSLCHEFCRRRLSSSVHKCSFVANLAAIRPQKCFKQSVGRLLQWKRAPCIGRAAALRCKGDMTVVESHPDCTGNTKVTTKVTTRTASHVVAYRESYKVFGGVLYSGSE